MGLDDSFWNLLWNVLNLMKIPTKSLCKFQHNLSLKKISSRQIQQKSTKKSSKNCPSKSCHPKWQFCTSNESKAALQLGALAAKRSGAERSNWSKFKSTPWQFDGWKFEKSPFFVRKKIWFLWTSCRYFVIVIMDILWYFDMIYDTDIILWFYDIGHVLIFVLSVWPGAVPLARAAPAAASAGSARERSLAVRWGPAAYLASHPPWWSRQHPQAWWKVKKMKELAAYLTK